MTFRHLSESGAELNFQGAEYQFIGIDEVTDLAQDQYRFLFSRLRRPEGMAAPLRMRSASNPQGPGLEWVRERFIMGEQPDRVVIRARLEDNPYLERESYEAHLKELGPVGYRQLRLGDWMVRPEGGLFQGEWFENRFVQREDLPDRLQLCRAWDLAATEARAGSDPDYTAGVLLGRTPKATYYVLETQRARLSPLKVEELVARTAERDAAWARDRGFTPPRIVMEQEPGSAGKGIVDHYRRTVLPKFSVRPVRSTGTKQSRADPVAARAEAGDLLICSGPWTTAFVDELVVFPMGGHDDQVDALSMAFAELASGRFHGLTTIGGSSRESYYRNA